MSQGFSFPELDRRQRPAWTSRRLTAIAAAAVGVVVLAGCGTDSDSDHAGTSSGASLSSGASSPAPGSSAQSGGSSASSAASQSADANATPQPNDAPFAADTNVDTGQASADAALVLTAIRSGMQQGFDRVVLEFDGPGMPGWTAQYAAAASAQGKGGAIDPGGSAILDILVSGTAIPKENQQTVAGGPVGVSGLQVVKGIYNDGTFEGTTHVVIGIDGKKPFRVFSIANPTRVVIDVQH